MPLSLTLDLLAERYALTHLPQDAQVPSWPQGSFVAVLRSVDEVTVVSEESAVPDGLRTRRRFRCLRIVGSFDIDSVGIVAAVTHPIAEAGISIFAFSTWSTDFILNAEDDLPRATLALVAAGHEVK